MSSKIIKEIPFTESTIETIDYAIFDWLNEEMNLSCVTNDGFKKVDVIWVSGERAYQVKKSREARDIAGTVNLPIITIERTGFDKNLERKGSAFGNVPPVKDEKGGVSSIVIARRINQDKTSEFANADSFKKRKQINFPRKNKKIVYETMSVPMPVYIDIEYSIKVKTLYQQQMNELIQPFTNKTGGVNYFLVKREGHRYESFIQGDFNYNNNISALSEEERKYETTIKIKVLGYLLGLGANQEQPKIVIRENAVEIKIPRERVIVGDLAEHNSKNQGYIGINGLDSDSD